MAEGSGRSEQPGDQQHNPWAPPEPGSVPGSDQRQRKVANEPTLTDFSGGKPPPPPPIPPAPQQPQQPRTPAPYPGQVSHPYHGGTGAAYGYPAAPAAYAGQLPYGYGWQGPPPPAGTSVAAMVLGIVSCVLVVTCWGSFLGIFTSVVAICLGVSARRRVARGEQSGYGQATAGLVMGIISAVLSALMMGLLIVGFIAADRSAPAGDSDGTSLDARGAVTHTLPRA